MKKSEQRSRIRASIDFRDVFTSDGFQFAADDVGGKAGAKEAAIEGGELLLVEIGTLATHLKVAATFAAGSAKGAQLTFDALADESGFVGGLGDFVEGGFDVAIGNSTGAEVARDAKLALLSPLGAVAGELGGVAGVVDVAVLLEARHHVLYQRGVIAAALERLLHFMDGMRAAHEDFDGGVVEGGFRVELARLGEHRRKMK